MKTRSILITITITLLMMKPLCAQELRNLELIYGDWQLSTKESTDSILVFHSKKYNTTDKYALRDIISFKENKEGIISIIEHHDSEFCAVPYSSQVLGIEKWLIVKPINRIERMFYDEKEQLMYSCSYQINHLKKNYLELNLVSEYFNEDWDEQN